MLSVEQASSMMVTSIQRRRGGRTFPFPCQLAVRRLIPALLLALLLPPCITPQVACGFAFTFSFANPGVVNTVTHPQGYTGTGGDLTVSLGIDPFSPNQDAMVIPIMNVIATWNRLVPTVGNIDRPSAQVPDGAYDFESIVLHEVGHALGLDHPNLGAMPPTVTGANEDHTSAQVGQNGQFDLNPGPDMIIGSADDQRGDDLNRNYFRASNNNPFTIGSVVDSTTYSRDLADLPPGDSFSTNANRDVATLFDEIPDNTESVMQQKALINEAQRTLGHDDVAGLLYAMSGVDELEGTDDDYTLSLTYAGFDADADIVVGFDTVSAFAFTELTGTRGIGGDQNHFQITNAEIHLHPTNVTWFFNDQLSVAVPEPGSWALLAMALAAGAAIRRRKRASGQPNVAK